jgi:hypothetical protein
MENSLSETDAYFYAAGVNKRHTVLVSLNGAESREVSDRKKPLSRPCQAHPRLLVWAFVSQLQHVVISSTKSKGTALYFGDAL